MVMAPSRAFHPSDDTVPSTPIAGDNAIFSDEAHVASTPPSSPPGFPWEQQQDKVASTSPVRPHRPSRNAFSVLGKRKALGPVSDNARAAKKATSSTTAKHDLTQMQISLGQEVQRKCKTCGMEYIASSAEDRKLHDKYHKQNAEGYDVGKDFVKKARNGSLFKPANAGDTIVAIDHFDSSWRKKRVKAALDVVQRELGAVDISDKELWGVEAPGVSAMSSIGRYISYMYLLGTKCVGFLLAEQIVEAHAVAEPAKPLPAKSNSAQTKPISALEALRLRQSASLVDPDQPPQPIALATQASPAGLGISRIWTSPNARGQGVAAALLEIALSHHNERVRFNNDAHRKWLAEREREESNPSEANWQSINWEMKIIEKEHVAFSQPTEAGAKLARKWFGKTYGWLVYVD